MQTGSSSLFNSSTYLMTFLIVLTSIYNNFNLNLVLSNFNTVLSYSNLKLNSNELR